MSRGAKADDARIYDAEVGKRIALTRLAVGVKAKDLARSASVSPSGLYNYEAGLSSCPPIVLRKIADALGVSVSALMPKFTTY